MLPLACHRGLQDRRLAGVFVKSRAMLASGFRFRPGLREHSLWREGVEARGRSSQRRRGRGGEPPPICPLRFEMQVFVISMMPFVIKIYL